MIVLCFAPNFKIFHHLIMFFACFTIITTQNAKALDNSVVVVGVTDQGIDIYPNALILDPTLLIP